MKFQRQDLIKSNHRYNQPTSFVYFGAHFFTIRYLAMASEFKKSLSLFDSIMLVAGSMIGSGIFIVSSDMAAQLGSTVLLLSAWALTSLLTISAALCYGELAGMFPQAGGQYVYLREIYGEKVGFMYGWTLFTVIQSGTIAAVAVAFAKFVGVLFPMFSEQNIALSLGGFSISFAQFLAVASIAVLTSINMKGVKEAKMIFFNYICFEIRSLTLCISNYS